VKAEAAANRDALLFYTDTLNTLKAEATEQSEWEIMEFKSSLKVKNKERKATLLADFDKRAPKPSLPSSTSVVPLLLLLSILHNVKLVLIDQTLLPDLLQVLFILDLYPNLVPLPLLLTLSLRAGPWIR